MDALHRIAENKINEAVANGEFDNLVGSGKPSLVGVQSYELDEQYLANHILKNNGFLPDWLAERKSLLEDIEKLHIDRKETIELSKQQKDIIRRLNRRISGYNLRVPVAAMQLQLVLIQE
jgi:DnaJ family protein C protein 28